MFRYVEQCLSACGVNPRVLTMGELPDDFLFHNEVMGQGGEVDALARHFIGESSKLLFVIPEYNGSMPGILKAFIDVVRPEYFRDKKAAIIGVATGRAGNLRGCDHLADILMHLGVVVMPGAIPVSSLRGLLDEENNLSDLATQQVLKRYVSRFLEF